MRGKGWWITGVRFRFKLMFRLDIVIGTFYKTVMFNSHKKPWRIGIQYVDEAMGTQDLCGLPRNHKLQNCRAEMMFFIYLVAPLTPTRKSNCTSLEVRSMNMNINSEFISSFLVITCTCLVIFESENVRFLRPFHNQYFKHKWSSYI